MERNHEALAAPPVINIQPAPTHQNSILPMWSALHD
jgi:hypothetical protein